MSDSGFLQEILFHSHLTSVAAASSELFTPNVCVSEPAVLTTISTLSQLLVFIFIYYIYIYIFLLRVSLLDPIGNLSGTGSVK